MTISVSRETQSEAERRAQVDALWAVRKAYATSLNAERAARFETNKAAILERDLPKSVVQREARPPAVFGRVAGGRA